MKPLDFSMGAEQTNPYLNMIKDVRSRKLVANFFETSVVSNIPEETILNLVNAINSDVEKGIFAFDDVRRFNAYKTMDDGQLNSETHKIFFEYY